MSRLLAKYAELTGPAIFQGKLYNIAGYPGAVPSVHPPDLVHGEVYRLHEPCLLLSRLDEYEECGDNFPQPTEYIRKIQQVRFIGGKIISAWVYIYNWPTDNLGLVSSGNFFDP